METNLPNHWRLVEQRSDNLPPQVLSLSSRPTTVGRTGQASVVLQSTAVSKMHASVSLVEETPVLQDLKSTNGTFVNDRRVERAELNPGDIVRFADARFCVVCEAVDPEGTQDSAKVPWTAALLNFEELMDPGGVVPHFQPIVRLADRQRIGFECLARSDLEELHNPKEMFAAATELGQEQDLSELMRRTSVKGASGLGGSPGLIFLNVHPSEGLSRRLRRSLEELRKSAPNLNLAIEVSDHVISDAGTMQGFRELVTDLEMKLAIDDFSGSRERVRQLAESPADFLKFDRNFIRGIDSKTGPQRDILRTLLDTVHRLGSDTVAVGVENAAEAETCVKLGFRLAQGFYFGRPDSIAALVEAAAETIGA